MDKNTRMTAKNIRKQLHEVIEQIENKETLRAAHHLLAQNLTKK